MENQEIQNPESGTGTATGINWKTKKAVSAVKSFLIYIIQDGISSILSI